MQVVQQTLKFYLRYKKAPSIRYLGRDFGGESGSHFYLSSTFFKSLMNSYVIALGMVSVCFNVIYWLH